MDDWVELTTLCVAVVADAFGSGGPNRRARPAHAAANASLGLDIVWSHVQRSRHHHPAGAEYSHCDAPRARACCRLLVMMAMYICSRVIASFWQECDPMLTQMRRHGGVLAVEDTKCAARPTCAAQRNLLRPAPAPTLPAKPDRVRVYNRGSCRVQIVPFFPWSHPYKNNVTAAASFSLYNITRQIDVASHIFLEALSGIASVLRRGGSGWS